MHQKYRPWASSAHQLFSVRKNITFGDSGNLIYFFPEIGRFLRELDKIHGSTGPWIHGSMDPWIHGSMESVDSMESMESMDS